MTEKEQVMQAVARGWCHEENAHKTMDSDLAMAITDEVLALARQMPDTYFGMIDSLSSSLIKTNEHVIKLSEAVTGLSARMSSAESLLTPVQ